jgi:hypothetical protein
MKSLIREDIFAAKDSEIWDACLACLACYHQEHSVVIIDSSEIMKPALHVSFIVCNFIYFPQNASPLRHTMDHWIFAARSWQVAANET